MTSGEMFGEPITRYGEQLVRLSHLVLVDGRGDQEVLYGSEYSTYPVDLPPVVEVPSIGLTLYAHVWEQRGWHIERPTR